MSDAGQNPTGIGSDLLTGRVLRFVAADRGSTCFSSVLELKCRCGAVGSQILIRPLRISLSNGIHPVAVRQGCSDDIW